MEWALHYNLKENLPPDTVSGIMLAVQQVTQGNVLCSFFCFMQNRCHFALVGEFGPQIYNLANEMNTELIWGK